MLTGQGFDARRFREPEDLEELAGLVIPGGESSTIGMLMERRGLIAPLRAAIASGLPVFGTCAGMILLANEIIGSQQVRLGGMDISVERNAYGSQIESFEATIEVNDPESKERFTLPGVFIRAPRISRVGKGVTVLARFAEAPILVRQGKLLAASFHPELTDCGRLHAYFAQNLCGQRSIGHVTERQMPHG
jgi:5'-phosphate synthase pdxT subunit